MSLTRALRSAFMRRAADAAALQRARARAESRRGGKPHEVLYFHQVDDPYSALAAQALRPFLERYDVRLLPRVVSGADAVAIHEPTLWDALARRDCAALAPFHGLRYADRGAPAAESIALARRILLAAENAADFPELAQHVDAALHDATALRALASVRGTLDPAAASARLRANFALRRRRGHYLGAMFHYAGEWYWGIDRLHYLEARLGELGAHRANAPPGPSVQRQVSLPRTRDPGRRLTLEFFASLRSPYTHLAYDRIADLCRRYPIDLVLRPVLPMMMRGVKLDRRKGAYIVHDVAREARRLGVPFGRVWDPIGAPVRRAYSLFPWARDQGRGFEYLQSYSTAVWAEGIDAMKPAGLRQIVERAGLPWDAAQRVLDNRDWEDEFEHNAGEMIAAGSWGVPTLRLPASGNQPAFTVWGQDRIWLMEEQIARRLGATQEH